MTPFFETSDITIYQADARAAWRHLPERSVDAIVTSPPYFGLRDYGVEGQLGLEEDPRTYIDTLADLLTGFGEHTLKPTGSLWLNLGDSYASRWRAGCDPGGVGRSTLDGTPQRLRIGGPQPNDLHRRGATSQVEAVRNALSAGPGDLPPKSLLMIPERVAWALIERGWILRNRVVWAKPNGMPTSATDRLANKHEALFHLVRQRHYHYDLDAIREPFAPASVVRGQAHRARKTGRRDATIYPGAPGQTLDARAYLDGAGANPGDVWTIPTVPYADAHFAVFPPELIRRPILATVPEGGTVLDPFFGSGTTAVMARKLGRRTVGVELSPAYCRLAADRFRQDVLPVVPEVPA